MSDGSTFWSGIQARQFWLKCLVWHTSFIDFGLSMRLSFAPQLW